jgi:RNA polymerase sigma factor (sigma-70 family)
LELPAMVGFTGVGREAELPERADFEETTLPHLKSLFRLALRLTGDPTSAEDLVQETYLRALQSFGTLRDPARVKPWLFQILNRLVIDRHRTRDRELPTDLEALDRFSLYDLISDEDPFPYSDRLHVTEKQWNARVADFRKPLDAFKVPAAEQSELVGIVGSTKPDIVVAGK